MLSVSDIFLYWENFPIVPKPCFLLKKYFALLFYIAFALAHGKDLVEEIKSETSGDLQTTLIKLAEVWDTLISMTEEASCFYSSTRANN